MKDEKKLSNDIAVKGKGAAWFDNYWYHYKWPTIGAILAIIIFTVCILQTCTKEKHDIIIVYAGPTYLSTSQTEQLSQVMDSVMPYDFYDDGDKNSSMSMYEIYSEAQIKEINGSGSDKKIDTSRNTSQYQMYLSKQQTGETSLYFMDPWLYETMDKDYLLPVSEMLGDTQVDGLMDDGYGVRLGDTELYEEYSVLQLLPEDTVICVMQPLVWGGSSDEEIYGFAKEMFCAVVTHEAEK